MVMTFGLGLKAPNGWGGTDKTPTFDSWVEKGGRRVLVASAAATCSGCAVALPVVAATAGAV
jgi:hypothetical protein